MYPSILGWIVIGIIAGWLTGKIMRGAGYGIIVDLILGLVGAVIGGWIFRLFGISAFGFLGSLAAATVGASAFGLLGSVAAATVGAVVLVAIARAFS